MEEKILNVTTDNAVIGAVIAQLREMRKPPMRQFELADLMGLTAPSWSRVEKGETPLSAAQMRALSKIFGITSDRIFELAEKATELLRGKGISVESQGFLKSLAKSETTNNLSGSALAGLAASGVIPIFGPVLLGIIGSVMAYNNIKKQDKEQ